MTAVGMLVNDVEACVKRGRADQHGATLSRLTHLFVATADRLAEEQVGVFDVVIGRLARAIERGARIELAERLAPVPNAPVGVVRQLALDEIAVARPVLIGSARLSEADLVAVAAARGRDHMLAITERPGLGTLVTDFLILRGGRVVTHAVAANLSARFSLHGLGVMVMRAREDMALQFTLSSRSDLPPDLAERLLAAAKSAARRRLAATLAPAESGAIASAVERGATGVSNPARIQDALGRFSAALADVRRLESAGRLTESAVAEFAAAGKLEHAVCATALLAAISLPAMERIIVGSDRDAVLVVARGLGWSWETTRAVLGLRQEDGARDGGARLLPRFEEMAPATAQRVLGFLRMRDDTP